MTAEPKTPTPRPDVHSLDASRLRELLEDYVRDKEQIGADLGIPAGPERLHHKRQRRAVADILRENRAMRQALARIHEKLRGPAGNRSLMQIAGPARECRNIAKLFLSDSEP